MVGEARAASYYESLQNATEYPQKFNPTMNEVVRILPVQMTSLAQWVKANKAYS